MTKIMQSESSTLTETESKTLDFLNEICSEGIYEKSPFKIGKHIYAVSGWICARALWPHEEKFSAKTKNIGLTACYFGKAEQSICEHDWPSIEEIKKTNTEVCKLCDNNGVKTVRRLKTTYVEEEIECDCLLRPVIVSQRVIMFRLAKMICGLGKVKYADPVRVHLENDNTLSESEIIPFQSEHIFGFVLCATNDEAKRLLREFLDKTPG